MASIFLHSFKNKIFTGFYYIAILLNESEKMRFRLNSFIMLSILVASFVAGVCFYSEWRGMVEENEQLRKHRQELQSRVDSLQKEWERKNEYYNRLISDPEFVERVIKEKLGYSNPEDFVFRFIDSDTNETTDKEEKDDFSVPIVEPRKSLWAKIKSFFGVDAETVKTSSKVVKPAFRVDMTNASIEATENKKRKAAEFAEKVRVSADFNATSQPPEALSLPENVVLVSERSKGNLQEAQMRPVKVRLGGTNVGVRRVSKSALKPVRFLSRQ